MRLIAALPHPAVLLSRLACDLPPPARRRWTILAALLQIVVVAGFVETSAQGISSVASGVQEPLPVAPEGRLLRAFLDGMAVDRYWLRSHERVLWETGEPYEYRKGEALKPLGKDETHCSAFVAAAAQRLGIYLLRPPEHSHILLANAQFDWLQTAAAREADWRPVPTALQAQQLANGGQLVVAVVKNFTPTLAGHIAILAPCEKPAATILQEGPEICQAGFTNYRATSLQVGFGRHPGAWIPDGGGAVRFFANATSAQRMGDVSWNRQ